VITASQAWRRFQRSVELMDRWLTAYETRYGKQAQQLMDRDNLTRAQAEIILDSLPQPEPLLAYQLAQYKWHRDESKAWKDVWQAIVQHDALPAGDRDDY
jgi:hypothetical protein